MSGANVPTAWTSSPLLAKKMPAPAIPPPGTSARVPIAKISIQEARVGTLGYAKRACLNHLECRAYDSGNCVRHSGGVSCKAWNYAETRRFGKFACNRLVFFKSQFRYDFLTRMEVLPPLEPRTARAVPRGVAAA
jgi:hypothetical protein